MLVDMAGVASALFGIYTQLDCLPTCSNAELDMSNLMPLCVFLLISSREFAGALLASGFQGLDERSAVAYARVFKPAGFTVGSFLLLTQYSGMRWESVGEGEALPQPRDGRLRMLVSGAARVVEDSDCMAFKHTAELEVGNFIGDSTFPDIPDIVPDSAVFEATKDTLLLSWDVPRLHKVLAADARSKRLFEGLLQRSALSCMTQACATSTVAAEVGADLFTELTDGLRKSYSADRAAIWVHDECTHKLSTLLMNGHEKVCIEPVSIEVAGGGLAAAAFRSPHARRVADCYEDPSFNRSVDSQTGYRTKTMLCAPITSSCGKRVGVLQLINKLDEEGSIIEFSNKDEEAIQNVTGLLSALVHNMERDLKI
mmetsp:Transcript_76317/g.216015  ORF Transcript_76317/g.216015 Transcript_76317/m.216015 type:complete len:370 (-) Transcript_76317:63-1172(-)